MPGPASTRGRKRCRSQSASKIASRSKVITWPRRSAAISRIRSGSCSACSVRAASTRKRAKLRSSSAMVAGDRQRSHLDRRAQRVATLARKTRTSRRWNQATGTTSSMGSATPASTTSGCARCGPTPYWTPSPPPRTRSPCCRCRERRSGRPAGRHTRRRPRGAPWRPRSHRRPAATTGVEKDEVGSEISDQPAIERRRQHPVDRQQEAEVAKCRGVAEASTSSRSASISLWTIQASSPGFTAWRRASAQHRNRPRRCRSRCSGNEQHRRTGVLSERQRGRDERARRDVGRARQRLVPQIDAVDEVDHRLQRHPRPRRLRGTARAIHRP